MNRRITEADVAPLYDAAKDLLALIDDDAKEAQHPRLTAALIEDWRRLRGLIVALETGEQDLVDIPGLRGLDAEARAIREEQGKRGTSDAGVVLFRAIPREDGTRDGEGGWEVFVSDQPVCSIRKSETDIADRALEPLWEWLGIVLRFDFELD
jgi:hypothetical protein